MSHPLVVNKLHATYDVDISRNGIWGNPFRIGVHGTRDEVIAKHRAWLPTQRRLIGRIGELQGKRLGCYCAPKPCHGDYLAELANPVMAAQIGLL